MKTCHLVFPALAFSRDLDDTTLLSVSDDTPTLLSLKTNLHQRLETGVDHLLDVVGSRNLTQMSGLVQNLVEDTISEGAGSEGYDLDGDVAAALDMIKRTLLGDIRGALKEAHCVDQTELHETILCFEKCENKKAEGAASCGQSCDGMAHKKCRDKLLIKYKEHITSCRALDDYVFDFGKDECPRAEKRCCLLSHSTWNCGGLCAGAIHGMEVDAYFGTWLQQQITTFEVAFEQWTKLHQECTEAYHAYVELDAQCDCAQAECEAANCEWETCHYLNCDDNYNRCWGRCEADYKRTNDAKECLEKDRKIDWSATEKIECYVNVLLEAPTKDMLLATCGAEDCFNKYREIMYKKCNEVCVEVDFEGEWGHHDRREHKEGAYSGRLTDVKDQATHQWEDIDVTGEGVENGVYTKHRGEGENRCTSHLDLDYQLPPCCKPCAEKPSSVCEGGDYDHSSYMWLQYGQYGHLSADKVDGDLGAICHYGEHTKAYAYNLCTCVDCPALPDPPSTVCTAAKQCEADYDYRKHDITDGCTAPTPPSPPPVPLPPSNCPTPDNAKACHFWGDPHFTHLFYNNKKLNDETKGGWHGGSILEFKPSGVFDLASSADGSFEAQAFFCPWVNTRAPGVGTGIAMRWGNDIVQVVKASTEADFTDFFVNGEKVSWDQLGNATSHLGKDVSGIGGLSSGFMYMQQMKTNRHQGSNKFPVCAGNGQDTIVEVAAHGNYQNYWSGVSIRTSQPGSSGICSVENGRMPGGPDVQERYRTDKKKILFSSRQMNHLCSVCNLGMHDHICGAPGHDATPEQVCDSVGASIETAKTECGKVFQDGTEWFNVCVMEECASGVEAVAVSKIEEHLQALMVEDEE